MMDNGRMMAWMMQDDGCWVMMTRMMMTMMLMMVMMLMMTMRVMIGLSGSRCLAQRNAHFFFLFLGPDSPRTFT